jgi:hypothetical protein
MSNSCCKINADIKSSILIISFAGQDRMYGGIQRFEFVNFLTKHFKDVDKHFYVDKHVNSYHEGIDGITKNIDETVEYLKKEISTYDKVILLGVSSGGYAAILFGSLLNVYAVLAFIPQTLRREKNIDEKYRDISRFIKNTTMYYLYGDSSNKNALCSHHISQCERIANRPNVKIIKKHSFNLKEIRDSGELYSILEEIIKYPLFPAVWKEEEIIDEKN